ncbi:Protein MOR1 [Picochlorum sp. SENEW3]|nr:Protein MOR1 [Picochlorum sp. SENEW3]WPT15587.1 Protein MOR1 [Picochlorum sp. SENEW3]
MSQEQQHDRAVEEARGLPLAERIRHSNWKVRTEAFEYVTEECNSLHGVEFDGDGGKERARQGMLSIGMLLAKAVGDPNANAIDKALDALGSYLDNVVVDVSEAVGVAGEACKVMAVSCLKARAGTVGRAKEVYMKCIEWEQGERVVEALVEKGMESKVPKAVVAALDVLLEAVGSFEMRSKGGSSERALDPRPIMQALPKVFTHSNAAVRGKVKDIVVEMGVHLGVGVVQGTLIDALPDVMKKEVVESLSSASKERRFEKRYLRREQVREEEEDVEMMDVEEEEQEAAACVEPGMEDAFEYATPVDILPVLQKTSLTVGDDTFMFWDCFESKKWNVRKAAVEKIKDVASVPRLALGDYSGIVRELKKILSKDANIHCAAGAASAAENMAKGLRGDFYQYAKQLCSAIMFRFKEKNPVMSQAADSSLQAFGTYCYSLKDISDDIVSSLGQKNPKVKYDTLRYLEYMVSLADKVAVSQCKDALAAAVKLAPDADVKIREQSQTVIVAYAQKLGGFGAIKSYLNGLDSSRKDLIEKAVLEARNSNASTKETKAPVAKARRRDVQKENDSSARIQAASHKQPKQKKQPESKRIEQKKATSVPETKQHGAKAVENPMSSERAEEFLMQTVGAEVLEDLQSPSWQARLEGMNTVLDRSSEIFAGQDGNLILALTKVPGWGDKNFQVLNKLFEVCTKAAEESGDFGPAQACCVVEGAVEKIHELKHRAQASNALTATCERVGPQYVVSLVHQKAAWHKNPKVLSESLSWMANTIDQFGYKEIDNQGSVLAWMRDDLGSANAPVRSQAIALLGVCHSQVGSGPFQGLLESLKPALVTSIQEMFAKKPVDTTYEPTKRKREGSTIVDNNVSSPLESDELLEHDPVLIQEEVEDVVERVDVAHQLNDSLIAQLSSTNWKERNAAVGSVEDILTSAKHITPNLSSEFLVALKGRFGDANRNLAAKSLHVTSQLAAAVGSPFDKLAHAIVLDPAIANLADTKKQVRDAVVTLLDSWGKTCPRERLYPALLAAVSNPKGHSDGKVAALKWMLDNFQSNSSKCREISAKAASFASKDKVAAVREVGGELGRLASGAPTSTPAKPALSQKPRIPVTATPKRSNTTLEAKSEKVRGIASRNSAKKVAPRMADAEDDVDDPLLRMGHGKGARLRQFRPKPGDFLPPTLQERKQLEESMLPVVCPSLHKQMFSSDFQDHVLAAEALLNATPTLMSEISTSLDFIFRWLVIVLCDSNTRSTVKSLELIKAILETLEDDGYRLSDMEAHLLLPGVIEKSGQNQDYLRTSYRNVIVQTSSVYNPAKVVDYIVQGLNSKNSRSKTECCKALCEIVERHGGKCIVTAKQSPVLSLSEFAMERDAALRLSAMKALEAIQDALGNDTFLTLLSKCEEKNMDVIQSKLARKDVQDEAPMPVETITPEASKYLEQANKTQYSAPKAYNAMEISYRDAYTPHSLGLTPETETHDVDYSGHAQAAMTPVPADPMPGVDSGNIETPVPQDLKLTPGLHEVDQSSPSVSSYDDDEVENRLEQCIESMYSTDLSIAVEATKQICADIMMISSQDTRAPSKRILAVLSSSADRFFLAICAQLELIFAKAEEQTASGGEPPSCRGCKFALNALLQGLRIPEIAQSVPQATLRTTISLLLCSLVNENGLLSFEQGTTLVRAVNVLIANLLDASDKNYAFAALLHLLRSPPKQLDEDLIQKFNDLLVKCLIKLTKSLETGRSNIDISALLLSLHDYFMFLGVEEIRKRSAAEDKPLRMVKTILHQICKLTGYNVYQYASGIPGRHSQPQPIIFRYIDINLKMLKEMNQLPSESDNFMEPSSSHEPDGASIQPKMGSEALLLEEEARLRLKGILSRVTSRDPAVKDAAMKELLEIKHKHPKMLAKYLAGTQDRFKSYIEESLRILESNGGLGSTVAHQPSPLNKTSLSYARERLAKETTGLPVRNYQTNASHSVDELAQRMAKLRQQSVAK